MLLTDKAALITGGGRGIGEASARRLAEYGAKVILADMNLEAAQGVAEDLNAHGSEARALEFNVAEFDKIPGKIAEARAMFGRIDILVNVAGITGSTPIEEITLESWDRMMDIDLKSMFFVTQAVFAVMKEQGYGKLVHMSSLAALRGGRSSDASYACAKAGVDKLTQYTALQYGKQNIRCNCVRPGLIVTPENEAYVPQMLKDIFLSNIEVNRYGCPEDIGHMCVYLGSDESSYVTGQIVNVDGGLNSHVATAAQFRQLNSRTW